MMLPWVRWTWPRRIASQPSNAPSSSAIESNDCDDPVVVKQNPEAQVSVVVTDPVTYQLCKSPDLVGVHAPADLAVDAVRWCV